MGSILGRGNRQHKASKAGVSLTCDWNEGRYGDLTHTGRDKHRPGMHVPEDLIRSVSLSLSVIGGVEGFA